jgi:RNA polymerase sigma factor (TIGR02999 family)
VSGPQDLTRLFEAWNRGDHGALDRLVAILYEELHRLASHYMRGERHGHVLQTTALVNEAYLRLVDRHSVSCVSRSEFFGIAAQVMRRVLVDYARGRDRVKRGEGAAPVALEEAAVVSDDRAAELIAIHSALDNLAALDPRKGKVFELRYFGGMSVEEVADLLRVSPVTVARDWRMAKVWLRREIASPSERAN